MSVTPGWPGSGRITLALLAVVPAVLAYPWRSSRDYWVLGIAVAVVILLFGWWRGLYFTTILRRRLAIARRRSDRARIRQRHKDYGATANRAAGVRLGRAAAAAACRVLEPLRRACRHDPNHQPRHTHLEPRPGSA